MSVASTAHKAGQVLLVVLLGFVYVIGLTLVTLAHWTRERLSRPRVTSVRSPGERQRDETHPGTE